ncbi:MAG: hypothetical protein ACQBVK_03460 [Candidatus Phytoplasma sp. TWB_XP]
MDEGGQADAFELTMSYEVVDENGKQIGTPDSKLDDAQKTQSELKEGQEF